MAKIEELIPFILYFEAGLLPKYLTLPPEQMFLQAKKTGFANDPADAGGATMCGITIGTYRTYRASRGFKTTTVNDLKNISYEDWRAVLKRLYWDRWKADQIADQSLANTLVDWVWASGTNGIKIPQRLLGVSSDGIVGAKTLAALNDRNPQTFFGEIQAARRQFIDDIIKRRPANAKFRNGWLRRIGCITYGKLIYR